MSDSSSALKRATGRSAFRFERTAFCGQTRSGEKEAGVKGAREHDIAQALVEYNSEEHMKGETLPPEEQVYRVKVVSAFLRAAVPLSKLEYFRDLLEENGHKLSDRRHMSDLIPFVLKQEQACLRKEIEGKHVAIIFDGTTRLGEVLAVVLRLLLMILSFNSA